MSGLAPPYLQQALPPRSTVCLLGEGWRRAEGGISAQGLFLFWALSSGMELDHRSGSKSRDGNWWSMQPPPSSSVLQTESI